MGSSEILLTEYGPIASNFTSAQLADLCVPGEGVQTGPFGSQLHSSDYVDFGTPIITVEHLGENRILHQNLPRITEEDRRRLSKYSLRSGDIVFSRVGSVDRRAIVRNEENGWLFSGRCLRVRPDPDLVNPDFLSWFFGLPTFKDHIRRIAVGATMPSLNTKLLSDVTIYFPPLPEQRAIAAVLGSLDDKIELNRRMNATLEATARALFKSWFVDFDPVRAKMAGRETGLPSEIEALFPEKMGEDGRPLGWGVEPLDAVATYLNGLALQKYPATGEAYLPVIKIAQLRKGNTTGADRASPEIPPEYVIDDGDVLFSWSGSLEVVIWSGGKGALNQHLFKVTSDRNPKWFYYHWTKEHLSEFREIAAGKATTMGHIQRKHLTQAKVLIPPQALVKAMDCFMSPLIERIVECDVESRTLAALRDALLPRLMSGEVRVPHTN